MNIAWIGLGNMGRPMAANLVAAGHDVLGYDLVDAAREAAAAAGIPVVDTLAAAVAEADLVITMLPRAEHVAAALQGPEGVFAHARPGAVVVDSSTIDVDSAVGFHAAAEAAGFRFLDAPVSGGVGGAAKGTLTFMIGGDAEVLADVRPAIEAMAGSIFHLGDAGKGQAAKTVNNMMLGISLAALSEGAVLAERLGLDAGEFYELAKVSSGDSWAVRNWYPVAGVVDTAAVNRDFAAGFSVRLLAKDMALALQAGESAGVELRYAQRIADDLDRLIERGDGDYDSSYFVSLVGTRGADAADESPTIDNDLRLSA